MKYSFEIVKGETDYYRIHDENDNAVGGCYHPDNARLLVDALNATHRARAIGVAFVEANRMRALRWHNGNLGNWSAAEWGNAIAGECGEFCNVAKKILRFDKDMQQRAVVNDEEGARDARGALMIKAGRELADIVTYCVVTSCAMGIDLDEAVRIKFNEISEREGFPERV